METSGLGGVFPSGIVIGTVQEVLPGSSTTSPRMPCSAPAVDFTNIRYCMIIKAFEEGEPTPVQPDDGTQEEGLMILIEKSRLHVIGAYGALGLAVFLLQTTLLSGWESPPNHPRYDGGRRGVRGRI